MTCSLGISNFLEEIPSLSCPIVFLYFFALITEEGFLISSCYSLALPSLFPCARCYRSQQAQGASATSVPQIPHPEAADLSSDSDH